MNAGSGFLLVTSNCRLNKIAIKIIKAQPITQIKKTYKGTHKINCHPGPGASLPKNNKAEIKDPTFGLCFKTLIAKIEQDQTADQQAIKILTFTNITFLNE